MVVLGIMGTRSLIRIKEDGQTLLAMYGQWDGYLIGGVGEKLIRFLAKMRVSNGISDYSEKNVANGEGCLAAQIVRHFKTPDRAKSPVTEKRNSCVGRFYIVPAKQSDEECTYNVRVENGIVFVDVKSWLPSVGDEDGRKIKGEKKASEWLAFILKEKAKIASQKEKAKVS